jgi:hypothetical protein
MKFRFAPTIAHLKTRGLQGLFAARTLQKVTAIAVALTIASLFCDCHLGEP